MVDLIGFAMDGVQMQLVVRLRCLFVFLDTGELWAFVPKFVALQVRRQCSSEHGAASINGASLLVSCINAQAWSQLVWYAWQVLVLLEVVT